MRTRNSLLRRRLNAGSVKDWTAILSTAGFLARTRLWRCRLINATVARAVFFSLSGGFSTCLLGWHSLASVPWPCSSRVAHGQVGK